MKESQDPRVNDFDRLAEVYDELVSWAPYELWVEELVERLWRHGLDPGARVLDAACGTGLSTVPLARRGFRVTGVDRSDPMLRRARRRAGEVGLEVGFHRQDLLELDLPERFDAVVCMHSGLDYLLSLEELARAFRRLRSALREGGLFAFDKCLDEPEFYGETRTDHKQLEDGVALLEYAWDRERKIMQQRCRLMRAGQGGEVRRQEVVHRLLAVSVEKLVRMLDEAGFQMLEPPRQFRVPDPGMGIFRAV